MEMIERKAHGEQVVTHEAPSERPQRVINLMDALQKSLDAARESGKKPAARHHPAHRKTTSRKGKKRTA